MNRNNKLLVVFFSFAAVLSAASFFVYNRYISNKSETSNFINKIRKENKAGFDSLQNAIAYENGLNQRIEQSIKDKDFETARSLMDSLPPFGKTHSIHLYEGMIYEEQKKYPDAVKEYSAALSEQKFSVALEKRGDIYVKMNKLNMAMTDYKMAYTWNSDYSFQIANTFVLLNKRDSALKYYQIYLEHYPNDTSVQQKMNLLKSH